MKADYRVIYLATDYSYTIIGRNKRDYAWIMSRKPTMTESDMTFALEFIERAGYDTNELIQVPQRWQND
ncbi:MAG: lipocalin family protein [Woeseiaceae bacterium]